MADEPNMDDESGLLSEEGQEDQQQTEETSPSGYVTKEDYDRLARQLDTLQQNLGYAIQARNTPAPTGPAPRKKLTDEEIQEMVDAGQSAEVMRMLAREVADAEIRPELENLRTVGLASLERIAKRDGLQGKKYYDRFKDKIEEYMRQLPQESRVMPEFYEMAYNVVVGQNMDALLQEEMEAAKRRAIAGPADDPTGGGPRGRHRPGQNVTPQPEDMFDAEVLASLNQKGGPDAWAKSFGYDSWDDYAKKTAWNDEWTAEYQVGGKRH